MTARDTILAGAERRLPSGIEFFWRAGAGIPHVLLHGVGSNASSFARLLSHLDPQHPVLAWNAPGYGASAPLSVDWPSARDYAAALDRLLEDRLADERVIVLGHSLGTLMAARFAATRPQRCAAVVLASPAIGYGTIPGEPLAEPARARLEELARLGPEAFADARAPRLVHDPEHHPDVLDDVRRAMAAVRMPGYGQAVRMLASGRLLDDVRGLEVPAAVICGLEDRITPFDEAQAVAAAVPDQWRVADSPVPVAACGHALPQEKPAALAELIAAISSLAGRAPRERTSPARTPGAP
jgi:pimeloyl-ACP methyl ester carboxylesterase